VVPRLDRGLDPGDLDIRDFELLRGDGERRIPDSALLPATLDGRTVESPAGMLVIEAAKRAGIGIPSFCYYEGLTLQGACRMCPVEVERFPGGRSARVYYCRA
jgi:hypothetical protein